MIELHTVFSQKQRQALSKDLPTPLYFQLYKLLKNGILDGSFSNGAQLPTEGQLSEEFGVSRITSKRAMDELAREGLVERHRGRGTHVTHETDTSPMHAPMVGLLQEIESIGQNSSAVQNEAPPGENSPTSGPDQRKKDFGFTSCQAA